MKWASSISEKEDLKSALFDASEQIKLQFGNQRPDLIFIFLSPHYQPDWNKIPQWVEEMLAPRHLLGCSGGGIVGRGEEIERRPALSLTAALLPEVEIIPFCFQNDALPTLKSDRRIWEKLMGVAFEQTPHFILLPDPFSFDLSLLLNGLDFAFPWSKKLGGMASGAQEPGGNALFCGKEVLHTGIVGVALSGNIVVDSLVAQGCRPIGKPLIVTRCHANHIEQFDGRAPFEIMRELYEALPPEDQQLFKTSLFLGLGMKEGKENCQKGDFLIRNILGLDPQGGALAVGAVPHEKQVIQFHVRDAETSTQDLEMTLESYGENFNSAPAQGALLFSCMGRGFYLYGRPNHDSQIFKQSVGEIPLGGFFCNGEIGSVAGKTYLHGYTSAFGIFRPRH